MDDKDIYNFITGGLPGLKAFTSNRIKVAGDLILAQQLEDVFLKAGGIDKAKEYLQKATQSQIKSRSKL